MSLKDKINLDAPAFGPGAQELNVLSDEPASVEVEPEVEVDTNEDETVDSVEENKVPYSRFKNIHNRALEAEAEAERWRQRAEEIEQTRTARHEVPEYSDMPSYWVELYGDSEASQKAWQIQERREQDIERRAYEAGQRGAEELEQRQQQRVDSNVAAIDSNFDLLADYVGRDLTDKEQSAILDIVDDFTPKDEHGRYAGPLIPFEKAWEMYELKQSSATASKRKDRDSVASLSATGTQGNTEVTEEANKSWNPLARGTWRSRL